MAHALIPKQKDTADPFWIDAARQLFSRGAAVLWKRGETRNRVLLELLLKTELRELAEAMAGTETQSIVDLENPKTALSVRAMLTANIGTMDLLTDEGGAFSTGVNTTRPAGRRPCRRAVHARDAIRRK